MTATVPVSGRASAAAATAAAAAVRTAVRYVPSITASGVPVSGSNTATSAWCAGTPRDSLSRKYATSLAARPWPGTYPGIAASIPCAVTAAPRGGTEAVPALSARRASPSASNRASGSSS